MRLIFATNNQHKLHEMRIALGVAVEIISLSDAGITQEIPEPFDTLRENAAVKAKTIHAISGGQNCFSEDTGLLVDALDGEPGVHSARYAGLPASAENNTKKLLGALQQTNNRRARFITVICLIFQEKEFFFEGRCEGSILCKLTGDVGFGYDPVFQPDGSTKSFAEMGTPEKNIFSHRRKAGDQLIEFLQKQTV